jgi:hypothetical protein
MSLGYTAVKTMTGLIVVGSDQTSFVIPAEAHNFGTLYDAIKAKADFAAIKAIMTPDTAIASTLNAIGIEGFELKQAVDGEIGIFFDGVQLLGDVATRIKDFAKAGKSYTPLKNFLIKAMSGKNEKRMDGLFYFVESNHLPIHPDGDVIAFKSTRSDGYDQHSGKVLYELGKYLEVENFDEDTHALCSTGLHIGGRNYVQGFRRSDSKLFLVKVNPIDFVAYKSAEWGKTRVRKLFVYGELENGLDLNDALKVLVASVPSGDAAQAFEDGLTDDRPVALEPISIAAAVDPEIEVFGGEVVTETVVAEPPKKRAVSRADRITKTHEPVFKRAGITYTATEILEMIQKHGQRGTAARTGIPRTTIQEWVKVIDAS